MIHRGKRVGFAMAAAIGVRGDYDTARLRELAKRSEDANQTRRLLALAAIYDGGSRTEAALRESRSGGLGIIHFERAMPCGSARALHSTIPQFPPKTVSARMRSKSGAQPSRKPRTARFRRSLAQAVRRRIGHQAARDSG
jgi:hypothetical protein